MSRSEMGFTWTARCEGLDRAMRGVVDFTLLLAGQVRTKRLFGFSAYSASKHTMTGCADCLRQDLLQHGVKVWVLFPPDTDTPMFTAENVSKPAETKALSGSIKVLSPEVVVNAFMGAIARGRYR